MSLLPGAEARAAAAGQTLSAEDVHRLRTTPKRSPHRGQYKASGYRRFR